MIIFISLNEDFVALMGQYGYPCHLMRIEDYVPNKKTFYVSPANSLGFMDGGIDFALSRIVFPNIESHVKQAIRHLNKKSRLGRHYLPIGSSLIIHTTNPLKSLIVAPTMLLPQNVSQTQNAYWATMAVLYNILCHQGHQLEEVDIILTSMCCGYGKMSASESVEQILRAIKDYPTYQPHKYNKLCVIGEPNLEEQPKIYENTEWLDISPDKIMTV